MALEPVPGPVVTESYRRARLDPVGRLRNDLINGESNAIGDIELTLNSATTVVDVNKAPAASLCTPGAFIDLQPTNAAMASEWNSTRPWVSSFDKGEFTITHANNANVRTLRFAIRVPTRR